MCKNNLYIKLRSRVLSGNLSQLRTSILKLNEFGLLIFLTNVYPQLPLFIFPSYFGRGGSVIAVVKQMNSLFSRCLQDIWTNLPKQRYWFRESHPGQKMSRALKNHKWKRSRFLKEIGIL